MNHDKLGRYQLLRLLGQGAMGRVYEGHDPNLDRRVAIKTIHVENLSDDEAAEYERRFRTEGRSIARLQHPNIVNVYDCDRDGDTAFLVMEFVQGQDLKQRLDSGTRYTPAQIAQLMANLLSALDYAHRQNIVHRDIKPANLLIEADGRLKLTDFGIARIEDADDATRTRGSMLGTLKYMSPEQVQGLPTSPASDLYACGIVLYELLTGVRPFDGGNDFELIQKIATQAPAQPSLICPDLTPEIDAFLARALAKSPADRYANAAAMATALHAAWSTLPLHLRTTPLSERRPSAETAEAQTQIMAVTPTVSNTHLTLPPGPVTEPPSRAAPTLAPTPHKSRAANWRRYAVLGGVAVIALSGFLLFEQSTPPAPSTAAPAPVEAVTDSAAHADTARPITEAPPLAAEPVKPPEPPLATPKPAAAKAAPAKGKLCGNRSIFTYGFCMNRACAKAENAKNPACLQWQAESERLNGGPRP
jgi:serine/threonine protein kinase